MKYSLASLLAIVSIVGLAFGVVHWEQQRLEREWLREQRAKEFFPDASFTLSDVEDTWLSYRWLGESGARNPRDRVVSICLVSNPGESAFERLRHFSHLRNFRCENVFESKDLVHVSRCGQLEDIYATSIVGDPGALTLLATLPKLRRLHVRCCGLDDAAVANICRSRKLSYLGLGGRGITDKSLSHIGELSDLEFLLLSNTSVTGERFSELSSCKELSELMVTGAALDRSSLRHISTLGSVRKLSLSDCSGMTAEGLDELRQLPRLESLDLPSSVANDRRIKWFENRGVDVFVDPP